MADDVISVLRRITGCWHWFGFVNFSELLEVKQKRGKKFLLSSKSSGGTENSASINSAAITQKIITDFPSVK